MCSHLLDYVNYYFDNWREALEADPYCLRIEQYDDYFFFNYTDKSDMTDEICREANCTVLRFNQDINKWICVCFPFSKIWKYEELKVHINWPTARVYSKIDGKLVCVWCDRGKWHVTTQDQFDYSKDDTFKEARGDTLLADFLSPEYCYVFNITAPKYKHVIDYGEKAQLWFISQRHMVLDKEDENIAALPPQIQQAHYFPYLKRATYVLALRKTFEPNECGMVVVDGNGNRMAVESFEYAHKDKIIKPKLTLMRMIELWQNDELEEYEDIVGKKVAAIGEFRIRIATLIEVLEKQEFAPSQKVLKRLKNLMPVTTALWELEEKPDIEKWLKNDIAAKNIAQELEFQKL